MRDRVGAARITWRAGGAFAALFVALPTISPAVTQSSADATWSRFRGPNGSGVAATAPLPAKLDPEQNALWRTPVPPGQSSPVLSPTKVFLTAYEGEALLTIALDRATGEVLWRAEAPRARSTKVDQRNTPASPSPVVDGELVVVFFADSGLVAYDHEGEQLWHTPFGPFDNIYGMGASPILVGDSVVLACDQNTGSFVTAVSKQDGKPIWKTERPHAKTGHCTPILYEPEDGQTQVLLPGSFFLDAYDAETGARVWWVGGLSCEMKSVPVLHDGTVYINGYASPMNQPGNQVSVPVFAEVIAESDADGDGRIAKTEMPKSRASGFFEFVDLDGDSLLDAEEWSYLRAALQSLNGMLAIRAGGTGDMTEKSVVWAYRRSVPQLPSPLVYEDVLYMLNDSGGLITTFHAKSGEVIERGRLTGAVDAYYASPVAGDGKVYLVSETGIVTVLPAGGGLVPLSTGHLDAQCHATPALADGRIYLRTEAALYCFGD